jgi:hypothetical protein
MNTEYQRLEAETSDVERQMRNLAETAVLRSSVDHSKLEQQMAELGRKLASLRQGQALIRTANSPEMQQAEREFVKGLGHKFHSQGTRDKVIQLPGGVTVTLLITYYHRLKCPRKAQRDGGRRGLFPLLPLLGIEGSYTPQMRKRMAQAAALLGSYEEAAEMLAGEGIDVSVNQLREVTAGMGRMLQRLSHQGALKVVGEVAGRRLVVSMDGGRVRLREPRRGKTKKGRKRFTPAWREPRLFIIYAVDEEGRMADDFLPVIDGTLGSCDQLFGLLLASLRSLNLTAAARVLFVADGAAWIWRRIPGLVKSLGLKEDQVQQLIDFWHAMEYLGKIADSKQLKGVHKTRWLKAQKKHLWGGDIERVVQEIKRLLGDRKTKVQKTWLNYFVTHGLTHHRMDYARSRTHQMPIGSGAIESAVRRVINLRVKSNAVYWLRDNAETIIRLRAWIKAGRADELFQQTTYITPTLAL